MRGARAGLRASRVNPGYGPSVASGPRAKLALSEKICYIGRLFD